MKKERKEHIPRTYAGIAYLINNRSKTLSQSFIHRGLVLENLNCWLFGQMQLVPQKPEEEETTEIGKEVAERTMNPEHGN